MHKTKLNVFSRNENEGYFAGLPEGIQEFTKEALQRGFQLRSVELWDSGTIEEIECRARDGFIPFSHNRGGLEIRGFTSLYSIWGSGSFPSHVKVRTILEERIERAQNDSQEFIFEKHQEELEAAGFKTKESVNYHALYEAKLGSLAEELSVTELENMGSEGNTIMYTIRLMYHGMDSRGIHSASLSAAVNIEGPYHRQSIPWAPSVFCEGAKEIEFSWKQESAYKRKLVDAIKRATKEVF